MRRTWLILFLLSALVMQAQELTVKSMEVAAGDLSASTQPRNDRNGQPCGLVKVRLAAPGAEFEGNIIGEVKYQTGEYWVYMTKGSFLLKMRHPDFIPLDLNFRDYGIRGVEPKTTYTLTILKPQVIVQQNAITGFDNGHELVDLGLSVRWATMNVGASSPEDYGGYFAWGETEPKIGYSWSTYKYCKGSYDSMTKYCTSSSYGTVDNRTVLERDDDVASVKWGGSWRMPTADELSELISKCTWTWTTHNGHSGYQVKGPNGNSIFLPAAGYRYGTSLGNVGSNGYYWSSSLSTADPSNARSLGFYSSDHYMGYDYRHYGQSVRPVSEP